MVTLTRSWRPENEVSLEDYVRATTAAFRRLRKRAVGRAIARGIWVVEPQREPAEEDGGGFRVRVHIHAVCDVVWVDKHTLSDRWKDAADGDFVVDVRRVKAATPKAFQKVAAYVAKYMTDGPIEHVGKARLAGKWGDVEPAPDDTPCPCCGEFIRWDFVGRALPDRVRALVKWGPYHVLDPPT